MQTLWRDTMRWVTGQSIYNLVHWFSHSVHEQCLWVRKSCGRDGTQEDWTAHGASLSTQETDHPGAPADPACDSCCSLVCRRGMALDRKSSLRTLCLGSDTPFPVITLGLALSRWYSKYSLPWLPLVSAKLLDLHMEWPLLQRFVF